MKTKTHLPMNTPFGVIDFEAYLTSAVDLQTNEISVSINFLGSNDTYIKVVKTSPQNAWKMYKSTQRTANIYDEIMSDLENCKKFEAWFAENVVHDLIEECPRCQGMGAEYRRTAEPAARVCRSTAGGAGLRVSRPDG